MESIFKTESWKVEKKLLDTKNFEEFTIGNANASNQMISLEYLNPLYFDGEVRIDIELKGQINLSLNNHNLTINSSKSDSHCILIKNWLLTCGSEKVSIDQKNFNELKLLFNSSTKVSKFTIVQDMLIEGCNK